MNLESVHDKGSWKFNSNYVLCQEARYIGNKTLKMKH